MFHVRPGFTSKVPTSHGYTCMRMPYSTTLMPTVTQPADDANSSSLTNATMPANHKGVQIDRF